MYQAGEEQDVEYEIKSMVKKVKDKAKEIKSKIMAKHHAHGGHDDPGVLPYLLPEYK